MQRAMTAAQDRSPTLSIQPYAIASGYVDKTGKPVTGNAWRVLAGEYSKYLLAKIKAFATIDF